MTALTISEATIRLLTQDHADGPQIGATVLCRPFAGQSVPAESTSWGGSKGVIPLRMSNFSLFHSRCAPYPRSQPFSAQESCAEKLTVALGPGGAGAVL